MAKPAKIKKDSDAAAPAKKGEKKAAVKGKVKEAPAKGKAAAAKAKEEPKGLKGRLAKTQTAKAKPAKGGKERKGAGQFLREVRVELSKVTWPTREEIIQSTLVVLLAVAVAGVFIYILDLIFSGIITRIS